MSTEERKLEANKYWTNVDGERYLQVEEVDKDYFRDINDDDKDNQRRTQHIWSTGEKCFTNNNQLHFFDKLDTLMNIQNEIKLTLKLVNNMFVILVEHRRRIILIHM